MPTNQEMIDSVSIELDRVAGSSGDVSRKACNLYAERLCSMIEFDEPLYGEMMGLIHGIEGGSSVHSFGYVYRAVSDLVESKNEDKGVIADFDDPE